METGDAPHGVSLEWLVAEYAPRLYRYAFHLLGNAADAEDLVQETFLDAHKSLHQLREPQKVLPWLMRILLSRRAKWARSQHKTIPLPMDGLVVEIPEPPEIWDRNDVAKALAQLPAEFREVLVLFYMQELKYREIAELTQTPIGTVMSRIARGKAILRKSLQGMIPASLDNPQAKENRDGPR